MCVITTLVYKINKKIFFSHESMPQLSIFIANLIFVRNLSLQPKYIQRLKAIRATLLRSDFFQTHEVIGSSLLFVHDRTQASIWMIDFAKTVSLPLDSKITHMNEWIVGNHEDGYLIGMCNVTRDLLC